MFPSDDGPTWQEQRDAYAPLELGPNLRVAFIHPDLGLGGAERLVVDAALALQQRGHDVEIFTSYHEDGKGARSFEETRNGSLKVHVLGNSIFPRSFFGRFTIVCAILRQLHLVVEFLWATLLFHLSSSLSFARAFALPLDIPFLASSDWSVRRQLEPFDVVVVDQLSTCVPFLRWFGFNRVVFYCHFPDQLLAPGSARVRDPRQPHGFSLARELESVYRIPIDHVETMTTGESDKILVNSDFTSQVFQRTFRVLGRIPRTVYPAVDPSKYGIRVEPNRDDEWLVSDTPTLLSINRFEGKKNIALAVEAFAKVRQDHPRLRLIVAGGFDPRLADNVVTLANLQKLAARLGLSQHTYSNVPVSPTDVARAVATSRDRPTISRDPPATSDRDCDVVFLLNMTSSQKSLLLSSGTSRGRGGSVDVVALLYTPMYEHFGIVPLEAMASRIPVVATTTGGPTETIIDGGLDDVVAIVAGDDNDDEDDDDGKEDDSKTTTMRTTGLLRAPKVDLWAEAIARLVQLSRRQRLAVGRAGRRRVEREFSVARLGRELERAVVDAASIGFPIPYETGFKKMIAFVVLAWICTICGMVAFGVGVYFDRQ